MVKFTKECRHAIPGQIYKGIQACSAWSNVLRNTSLQYLVKFTKEYKHAIPDLIYKGIQACNTWSNLLRNTSL